jgi:hypothetical protein
MPSSTSLQEEVPFYIMKLFHAALRLGLMVNTTNIQTSVLIMRS